MNTYYATIPYNVAHSSTGEVIRPGTLTVARNRGGKFHLKAVSPKRDRNVGHVVDVIDRPAEMVVVLDMDANMVADYGYDRGGYYTNPLVVPTRVGSQLIALTFTPVATWPGATLIHQPDAVTLPPKPYVDLSPIPDTPHSQLRG